VAPKAWPRFADTLPVNSTGAVGDRDAGDGPAGCPRGSVCISCGRVAEGVGNVGFETVEVEVDGPVNFACVFVPRGWKGLSTASFNLRTLRLPNPGQSSNCAGVACTILEKDPNCDFKVVTSVLFTLLTDVKTDLNIEL
jgi:hypothetical protein